MTWWRAVWARLMGRPEPMDEIHVTPQQAIDAYQASLPDVPAYASAIGPTRTEEERQALVDRINEALAAAHEPDAVTDLRAVPFDTPRPAVVFGVSTADDARNMKSKVDSFESWLHRVAPRELSTTIPTNPQGGSAMSVKFHEIYAGPDKDQAKASIDNSQGPNFIVIEDSDPKIAAAIAALGSLQGQQIGFNFQTLMVVGQLASVFGH